MTPPGVSWRPDFRHFFPNSPLGTGRVAVRECFDESRGVELFDAHPGVADLRREVLDGLSAEPRAIPPKFFYDERGSELFDQICELPEYYQTRTETAILQRALPELGDLIGPECLLVELGSGASKKVRLLLEQLRPSGYVGVDISKEFLLTSTQALARDYPWLEVHAACVDFSNGLEIPHGDLSAHKVAFFPVRALAISIRTTRCACWPTLAKWSVGTAIFLSVST